MTDQSNKATPIFAGAGGGGCFRAGTQVQLDGGKTIAIEQLKEGDEILAFDEGGEIRLAKVTKVHYHADPQPILKVKFWRGEMRGITPNHWVLNQYGNFAEMGRLTTHDALVDGMGHLRPIIDAELVAHEPVWNLTVEPYHTFIADGIRVHNGGHRDRFPVIAGAGGGGGKSEGRAAVEDPDSLQSRAMVALLDLLGEGQIGGLVAGGQSIFMDDTPIQNPDGSYNYKNVVYEERDGTQDQAPISGFGNVETPFNVSVRVRHDLSHTVSINNPNVDQVRVIVSIPSLMSQDKTTGDIHGTKVQYKFQASTDGGPFVDIMASRAWSAVGSAFTSEGHKAIQCAADAHGVGATLGVGSSNGGTGSVTVQPQVWTGAAWVNHGSRRTIYTVQSSANNPFLANIITASGTRTPTSLWVAATGYEQMRFVVTSSSVDVRFDENGNEVTGGGVYLSVSGIKSSVDVPTCTVSGKTRSRYQRHHLLTLPKPGASWQLRMVRLTADSTSSAVSDETYFDSYIEIVNAKLSYPNSALVGVVIDSAQFSSIPRRSYLVDGLLIRVPTNRDDATRAYDGVWDGTFKLASSDNPAWVLYDLLTHPRYGLGQFISEDQIDKARLYQIGRYCDELVDDGFGGKEPRFTVNTAIQARADAYRVIADLCSVFRGMAYWAGSSVGFLQDAPADSSMVFSQANVVDGVFNYAGSSRKDRHSVALVTWNDPAERYKQKVEYVEDAELVAKFGVRKIDTLAFGCTSRGQANRAGRWILHTERYESDMVQFKVGLDAALVMPGEIIAIHDQYRAGKRMGGRVVAATLTSIALDAPVTLASAGGRLSVRLPDGSFADRVVLEGAGTHAQLTWVEPLSVLPVANAIWLLAEAALEPMLARVIGIAQDGTNPTLFDIVAVEHNPSKYAAIEQGLKLEEMKTSVIDVDYVDAPSNFAVAETTYQVAPSVLGTKLHLSWTSRSPSFELRWRCTGKYATEWKTITTSSSSIDIDNVRKGIHEFVIVALSAFGKPSAAQSYSHDVQGKTTAPGDVANFKVSHRTNDLLLTWDAVQDIDVSGYELRVGPSWDSGEVITTAFNGTMLSHDQDYAGTYYYHIRSIDTSGNYSDNVTTTALVLDAPAPVSQFDCIQSGNRLEFRWLPNPETNIVGYEIREGTAWATSQFIVQVKATTYSLPSGAAGDRTFWIKAIASPGVYADVPVFVTTAVAQPSNMNVVWFDDERANGWTGVKHFANVTNYDLVMDPGVPRAEYLFDVDLGSVYRAQNTILGSLDSVVADSTTWADANFAWNSPDANRQWVDSGSMNSVSARYQIAPKKGLRAGEIDGWRLNDDLSSVVGLAPTLAQGVTYDQGRYGNGVHLKDTTNVAWSVSVPAIFSTTFWITPKEVTNAVFWRITGAGGIYLVVGYSVRRGCFYLEDHAANCVEVPYAFEAEQRICIGVSQQGGVRRLMVGRMGDGTAASGELPLAPIGACTQLRLY